MRHGHLIHRQARQPIPLLLGDRDSVTSTRLLPPMQLLVLPRLIENRASMDTVDHIIRARPEGALLPRGQVFDQRRIVQWPGASAFSCFTICTVQRGLPETEGGASQGATDNDKAERPRGSSHAEGSSCPNFDWCLGTRKALC